MKKTKISKSKKVKYEIKEEFKGCVIGGDFGGIKISGKVEELDDDEIDIILNTEGGKRLLNEMLVDKGGVIVSDEENDYKD